MLKKAYLEISNICNLSCAFCPGTKRAPRRLTPEEFRVLAARLRPYTEYLYLHLMGEPLLHPQLGELLEIAQELQFQVIVTTNATLLPARGELLLSSPAVHKVNLSLQSFEANASGELERYIRSCASFARKCSERNLLCVLRLWNEGGLDALNPRIRELLSEEFPLPWKESRRVSRKLAEKVYLEPGDKFDWPELGARDYGEECFCYALRDQIGILCDGTVVPCCLDKDGVLALGNLFEQELPEILESERAKRIYSGFSCRKAAEELCRRCGYARRFV